MDYFNQEELSRYTRHFSLENVGIEGQKKLKQASVLCVGAGGIGSPALLYLAAAGIGKLGIVDGDTVELSNLQRQILYSSEDLGIKKASTAKTKLERLNPNISCMSYKFILDPRNILDVVGSYDIVLDGSDNFPTRFLVNDACVKLAKPLVSASVLNFDGQLGIFNYEHSACYRCLYSTPPNPSLIPNCSEAGMLGVVTGIMGSMAANEVLKIILQLNHNKNSLLYLYSAQTNSIKSVIINKNPSCPTCRSGSSIKLCLDLPGPAANVALLKDKHRITCQQLKEMIAKGLEYRLVDVRDGAERMCGLVIEPSIHIPMGDIRSAVLPQDMPLILYCTSGQRSHLAASCLVSLGYQNVMSLEGGCLGWFADARRTTA